MSYRTLNPTESKELLDGGEGWIYVDVRSVEEYQAGHVPGAYNVPFAYLDPGGGMAPNMDFVEVMKKRFQPGDKLVVGCAAGGRSARACDLLEPAGFSNLVNMHGGFGGARDASGAVVEPGWQALGFPCEEECPPERAYAQLRG